MILQTLYKKASSGKITRWVIMSEGNKVITRFGYTDGKQQSTEDIIKGKNKGKANETSDEEQANVKAKQMHDKKIKAGYVPNESGETDLPSVVPMLAFPIEKKEKHVTFPCILQQKLDGIRCVTVVKNGKAKMYSRTRKEITTMQHIIDEVERECEPNANIILDGELYNHTMKDDFNKIISLIKRGETHEDAELIRYHIYDVVSDLPYLERIGCANEICKYAKFLEPVQSTVIQDQDGIDRMYQVFIEQGYEGAMYRNMRMPYENKRSVGLLKIKKMKDDEYEIIGINEGNGRLVGHVGSFVCITPKGKEFSAKLKGKTEYLKFLFEHQDDVIGKMMTVIYQNLTPDGLPRFPVAKAIRFESLCDEPRCESVRAASAERVRHDAEQRIKTKNL